MISVPLCSDGLSPAVCQAARLARDARFDGCFFVADQETGEYCRPVCPLPPSAPERVRFHLTAAGAQAQGFRPCARCRAERAPSPFEPSGPFRPPADDDLAYRALQRIEALGCSVPALAGGLGVDTRQLRRALQNRFGVGPAALLANRRLRLAKRLIDDSDANLAEVARSAGFGDARGLHAAVARAWRRTPLELRQLARRRRHETAPPARLRLPAVQPFAAEALAGFLAFRAVPGLERAEAGTLARAWQGADSSGEVMIELDPAGLTVTLDGTGTLPLTEILVQVRRLTDLDADSAAIDAALGRDPLLAPWVRAIPGRRVPGAWEGFELAVRAILGQQVSVAAARTLTARLLNLCSYRGLYAGQYEGEQEASAGGDSVLVPFPTPEQLLQTDLTGLGIPGARARAISLLAEAVVAGRLDFDEPVAAWRAALLRIPGIGPWTAEYVCMRAGRDPDAFPAGDLVVCSVLGDGSVPCSSRQALARAEAWRPWRAYGVLQLWASRSGAVPVAGEGRS